MEEFGFEQWLWYESAASTPQGEGLSDSASSGESTPKRNPNGRKGTLKCVGCRKDKVAVRLTFNFYLTMYSAKGKVRNAIIVGKKEGSVARNSLLARTPPPVAGSLQGNPNQAMTRFWISPINYVLRGGLRHKG